MHVQRWSTTAGVVLIGTGLAAVPALAAAGLLAAARPALHAARVAPVDAAAVVVAACALTGAAVLGWLALTVLAAGVDEVRARWSPSRSLRPTPGVPRAVRRVVAVVVGLLLGSAALSAGAAERGAAVSVPEAGWALSAPVEAGWDARTTVSTTPPAPTPASTPQRDTAAGAEYVVHRGDSLWSLAEQRCGPGAGAGTVLAEAQRIYAANIDVIGDDPDLLLPGQVLQLP